MTTSPMEWSLDEFTIQPLLWRLIEELVAEPERPDIKVVIGEGLVDENTELYEEAVTLLEIWQDYRNETDREEKNLALNQHLKKLPEPLLMRENLKKEVKMFTELLQQKANAGGRKVSKVLNEKDASIVEYVMEDTFNQRPSSAHSRPSTASTSRSSTSSGRPSTAWSSQDGRQTPMRATPKSQASSCASSLSDHLESMNENLNAMEIDRIAEHLREMFLDERNRLKDDIAFLQECLFEESDYRQHVLSSPDPEPSLKDLRVLGTKLEKELLNTSKIPNTPKSKANNLSGIKQKSLDENCMENVKSKTFIPRKPSIPHPPLSPPGRPTKTTIPTRSYSVPSSTSSPSGSASTTRKIVPSPPNSAKTQRPSTATRFRRLVVECRDMGQ